MGKMIYVLIIIFIVFISGCTLFSKSYDITYNLDGGINSSENPTKYKSGDSFNFLDASKEGYKFLYWVDENDNKITNISSDTTGDLSLKAKYEIINYTITYNLDGGRIEAPNTYTILDSITIPSPTKENYLFTNWTVGNQELISYVIESGSTGNLTLTANYEYAPYKITYNLNGGINSNDNPSYFNENSIINLKNPTRLGYNFLGWYDNSNKINTIDGSLKEDIVLEAKWEIITYSITLDGEFYSNYTIEDNVEINGSTKVGYDIKGYMKSNGTIIQSVIKGTTNDLVLTTFYEAIEYEISYVLDGNNNSLNKTKYTVEDSFNLYDASKDYYTFVGWKCNGSTITRINVGTTGNKIIYGYFTLNNYIISYSVPGLESNSNPTSYTINDSFTLVNPVLKAEASFLGWYIDSDYKTEITSIAKGSHGNLIIYAKVNSPFYTITFIHENISGIDPIIGYSGQIASKPIIEDLAGFETTWYTTSDYSEEYIFTTIPSSNITVYGKWNYTLDSSFFECENYTPDYLIDSYEELLCYIDYVLFYGIESNNSKPISFSYLSGEDSIEKEITRAFSQITYCDITTGITRSTLTSGGNTIHSIYCDSAKRANIATLSYKDEASIEQKENLLIRSGNRTDDFNSFKVDLITNTVSVSTTDQLVFALEHGIRPICVDGSIADVIYTKAKNVLKNIIDDSFSDLEKVITIIDWIVDNVTYDYDLANLSKYPYEAYYYDSFYLEGVFNNKIAVCDGIAKAMVVLCRIEGIPAVHASGNSHAWNKVMINNTWYVCDATWSTNTKLTINNEEYEIGNYNYYFTTDEKKEEDGYTSTKWTDLVANTEIDPFSSNTYQYNGSEFDLNIESKEELLLLLSYVNSLSDISGKYFEFNYDCENSINEIIVDNSLFTDYDLKIFSSSNSNMHIIYIK